MSVLKPEKKLTLTNGEVTVRELRAVDGMQLFELISGHMHKLTDDKGEFEITVQRFVALVAGVQELSRFVAKAATGGDDAWFDALSINELLLVLTAAVELNLSEEILKNGRGLKDLVTARILGPQAVTLPKIVTAAKPPSPAPLISS